MFTTPVKGHLYEIANGVIINTTFSNILQQLLADLKFVTIVNVYSLSLSKLAHCHIAHIMTIRVLNIKYCSYFIIK